jgi:hypothetical protein
LGGNDCSREGGKEGGEKKTKGLGEEEKKKERKKKKEKRPKKLKREL